MRSELKTLREEEAQSKSAVSDLFVPSDKLTVAICALLSRTAFSPLKAGTG